MKIYDSFLFFNELELLDIRFNELDSVVDYFVIVESTKTHQNKDKPLYYLENKNKFSKFNNKVIHHVFNPTELPYPWYIENEQRNQIKNASFNLQPADIILVSDADEIVKAETVTSIRNKKIEVKYASTCIMQMSYNYINTVIDSPWHHKGWRGTVILTYDAFYSRPVNDWRRIKDEIPRCEDAGWHLSFLGGAKKIKEKLESYAHKEFNNEYYTDINNIETRISSLNDPLNRPDLRMHLETDMSKFPASSLKFKELFYS